jgi:hypothetical protein
MGAMPRDESARKPSIPPRHDNMQHVLEPQRQAWIESPYVRSLLVSQLHPTTTTTANAPN